MRYDVVATLLGSVFLVGTIFFVGFRRWLPLLGMALCLLLSCLVALTLGQLLFGRLSMISVGFCAILVGLGVDFSILTIGRYHQARSDGEPHRQAIATSIRSEEHTSELQSQSNLVCRLLLEKKKNTTSARFLL